MLVPLCFAPFVGKEDPFFDSNTGRWLIQPNEPMIRYNLPKALLDSSLLLLENWHIRPMRLAIVGIKSTPGMEK